MSEVGISFGGPDRASMRLLGEWPGGLFFCPGVDIRQVNIYSFLSISLFGGGALKYSEESDYVTRFRFLTGIESMPYEEIRRYTEYFTSRVRNYAHLAFLAQAKIIDARADSDCHDWRLIKVADAVSWVKWFRTLSQDEYEEKVFGKDFGFPPYDIDCSCRMVGLIPGTDDWTEFRKRRAWQR